MDQKISSRSTFRKLVFFFSSFLCVARLYSLEDMIIILLGMRTRCSSLFYIQHYVLETLLFSDIEIAFNQLTTTLSNVMEIQFTSSMATLSAG